MSINTDILPINNSVSGEHVVAQALWRITQGETELAQTAVAWVIRNRITCRLPGSVTAGDVPLTPITRCAIESTCEEVIAEAAPATGRAQALGEGVEGAEGDAASYNQTQEVAQRVWRGDFSDPTGGATRCCRHDQAPTWPLQHPPLALLGSFLFYP